MGWCPHCNHGYDDDSDSQPCCLTCGHPLTCGGGCPDGRPISEAEQRMNKMIYGTTAAPPAREDE